MTKRWKPEINEIYYYISESFTVEVDCNKNVFTDKERIYCGNCFKTEKEAQAAVKKVKDLLLGLHEPATDCNQLPKLTTDVFDRKDCPEWARYAVVNSKGTLIFFGNKPNFEGEDYGCWSCSGYQYKHIRGIVFDHSDWENSLIERPAKLPEWCKVGEWVHYYCPDDEDNEGYYKIMDIDDYDGIHAQGVNTGVGHIVFNDKTWLCPAHLLPYPESEIEFLVGKVLCTPEGKRLIDAFCRKDGTIHTIDGWFYPDYLSTMEYTIDGKPCGKFEYLQSNGVWYS